MKELLLYLIREYPLLRSLIQLNLTSNDRDFWYWDLSKQSRFGMFLYFCGFQHRNLSRFKFNFTKWDITRTLLPMLSAFKRVKRYSYVVLFWAFQKYAVKIKCYDPRFENNCWTNLTTICKCRFGVINKRAK